MELTDWIKYLAIIVGLGLLVVIVAIGIGSAATKPAVNMINKQHEQIERY